MSRAAKAAHSGAAALVPPTDDQEPCEWIETPGLGVVRAERFWPAQLRTEVEEAASPPDMFGVEERPAVLDAGAAH